MQRKTWLDYVFVYAVGLAYVYALTRTIFSATILRSQMGALAPIALVCITVFIAIFYNRTTRLASLGVVVLLVIYGLFMLRAASYPHFHYAHHPVLEHIVGIFYMASGRIPQSAELARSAMWLLSMLFSLIAVLFMLYKFNLWVLSAGIFVTIFLTWTPGFTRDSVGFLLALFVFCVVLVRHMSGGRVSPVLVVGPLCAIAVVVTQFSLPQQSELYVRRSITEGLSTAGEGVSDLLFSFFNPTHFSFQTTGFGGHGGRLGGAAAPNNREVMTVRAPGLTYLSGATSNTFTGYSWVSTLQEGDIYTHGLPIGEFESLVITAAMIRNTAIVSDQQRFSFLALRDAFSAGDVRRLGAWDFQTIGIIYPQQAYLHVYLPQTTAEITMGRNRSGTIFRPPGAWGLSFIQGNDYTSAITTLPIGDMQTPRLMGRNTTYMQYFFDFDTSLDIVVEMLENMGYGTFANNTWAASLRNSSLGRYDHAMHDMQLLVNSFATHQPQDYVRYFHSAEHISQVLHYFERYVLLPYSQEVRAHFLSVPEVTPQRVHDLTMQIIEGQTSDFGRVMAIREFLLQFPYTLNTVPVPVGVCFVDHFLFETRQGYCTYFASAMAVMARIAGVPSRYVEGFVLPPAQAGMAYATVTNRMAHAWVDVYIEGYGWLLVEATPSYAFLQNQGPSAPREWENGGGLSEEELLYLMLQSMREEEDTPINWPGSGQDENLQDEYQVGSVIFSARLVFTILATLAAAVFFGAFLFVIYRHVRLKHAQKRIRKLTTNQRVIVYFGGVLNIATYHTNHPLATGETARDYGIYKGKRFAYSSDSVFLRDLITLYYRAKYSHHTITEAECKVMEEAYYDMLNLLRGIRWRPVFLYIRYVNKIGALNLHQNI